MEALLLQAAALVGSAQRIVALTGAGFSAPSGIPTFRSDSGLWNGVDPQQVASVGAFQANPQRFYRWMRPLIDQVMAAKPNPAHAALARLEQMGRLRAIVTQNIDGLHQKAGSREVLELHGQLRTGTCAACDRQVPSAPMLARMRHGHLPQCICGGVYKPDIVLFDEALPRGIYWLAREAVQHCDLLIIAGTSLEVAPANELPLLALANGAQLLIINRSATPLDSEAALVMHADVAQVLPTIVGQIEAYSKEHKT